MLRRSERTPDQRTDNPLRPTSLTCENVQKRIHTTGFMYSPLVGALHQFVVDGPGTIQFSIPSGIFQEFEPPNSELLGLAFAMIVLILAFDATTNA